MSAIASLHRPTWIEISESAIQHNVRVIQEQCGNAAVCAVVKANGYGHGSFVAAEAAMRGGASWLAVATVDEAVELRTKSIRAPICVLSEPASEAFELAAAHSIVVTLYSDDGVDAAERAAELAGKPLIVHMKVDTGMHRVGATLDTWERIARRISDSAHLHLSGVFTHMACGDNFDDTFTSTQLDRFAMVRTRLSELQIPVEFVHAANSATAIRREDARLDVVRVGIAIYGVAPETWMDSFVLGNGNLLGDELKPAMSLHSKVSFVKPVAAGEGLSYGLTYKTTQDTFIATLPIGYGDGVPRNHGHCGGEVLVGGDRYAIVGNVTMDQLLIDCGPRATVSVGDEAVLLGSQGKQRITANHWAGLHNTVGYEVLCGFSARVPRRIV